MAFATDLIVATKHIENNDTSLIVTVREWNPKDDEYEGEYTGKLLFNAIVNVCQDDQNEVIKAIRTTNSAGKCLFVDDFSQGTYLVKAYRSGYNSSQEYVSIIHNDEAATVTITLPSKSKTKLYYKELKRLIESKNHDDFEKASKILKKLRHSIDDFDSNPKLKGLLEQEKTLKLEAPNLFKEDHLNNKINK